MNWNDPTVANDFATMPKSTFLDRYPECSDAAYRGKKQRAGRTDFSSDSITDQLEELRTQIAELRYGSSESNEDRILRLVRSRRSVGITVEELSEETGLLCDEIVAIIARIQLERSDLFINAHNAVFWTHVPPPMQTRRVWDEDEVLIGVVSDTHFASIHEAREELAEFYRYAESRGVNFFVHAGDLDHGYNVYKGQEHEVQFGGFERHVNHIVNHYPKSRVPTYVIAGNHDEAWLKVAGADILTSVGRARTDLTGLGFYAGRLQVGTITVQLQHGGGANRIRGAEKVLSQYREAPDLLIIGHYHQFGMLSMRGTRVIYPGAFEGPETNLLLKRMGIDRSEVGGYLLKIQTNRKGASTLLYEEVRFA